MLINTLAQKYLEEHDSKTASDLVCLSRSMGLFNLGSFLGKYLSFIHPHNVMLNLEYSANLQNASNFREAFYVCKRVLDNRRLSQDLTTRIFHNRKVYIPTIENDWNFYNQELISKIINRKQRPIRLITLTMTSCKRYDLFTQTVNTFINCCTDLDRIDRWICIDDNSSDQDRKKMSDLYPFFEFVFKDKSAKGHPQSMNMILNMVDTPYVFHLEDDWKFFETRPYLTELLEVLNHDSSYGQCLINKNYSEISTDTIIGGDFRETNTGLRYYVHEYARTDQEKEEFSKKHGHGPSSSYWPHFSLRPSLIKTSVLKKVGSFNEQVSHFEMEYANRYFNQGYRSVFLETTYCLHTGRLTSEKNDPTKLNAYILNNEAQFSGKEELVKSKTDNTTNPIPSTVPSTTSNSIPSTALDTTPNFGLSVQEIRAKIPDISRIKTFVINLERRLDRWESFCIKQEPKFLEYSRFLAVDGSKLIPNTQLSQIFDNNDYNMRRGMVGCAMSHIKLLVDLISKEDIGTMYCILEDDTDFVPNFSDKFACCLESLSKVGWDMFYLGHHLWPKFINDEVYSKTIYPKIEKMNRTQSLARSMGGTIGYLITQTGAIKLLDYINKTGMTNGIDTVQQKAADTLNVYYAYPHLVYSDCYRGNNKDSIDTDIQFDYDSLTIPIEQRLQQELDYYKNKSIPIQEVQENDLVNKVTDILSGTSTECIYSRITDVTVLQSALTKFNSIGFNRYYTLENKYIFIVPVSEANAPIKRFFHRFKINNTWSVIPALQYKSE